MRIYFPQANGFRPGVAICACLFFPIALSAVMALKSDYNRHPDEIHHFEAAKYYTDHYFPPAIGDPEVLNSYSVWGVSYLNYHWVEYLFAGKFIRLTSGSLDPLTAARLYQVFLFLTLSVLFTYRSWKDGSNAILVSYLLISPQVWYVFSYVNNDAFALFVSLLICYQILYSKSLLQTYLNSAELNEKTSGGVLFGTLIGLQLIGKSNYWPFVAVAVAFLLISLTKNSLMLKKLLLIVAISAAIVGIRVGVDLAVNGETNFVGVSYINYLMPGWQSESKLSKYQDQIALPQYRVGTSESELAGTATELRLRDKGVPLSQLLTKMDWFGITFRSSVGVYGYMSVAAHRFFYRIMGLLFILFGSYLCLAILRGRETRAILELIVFIVGAGACVFASLYLSWVYAFQPQGRYMFPIIGMLSLLTFSNRRYLNNAVMHAFIFAAFALSVYSFVFVGITRIDMP